MIQTGADPAPFGQRELLGGRLASEADQVADGSRKQSRASASEHSAAGVQGPLIGPFGSFWLFDAQMDDIRHTF